MKIRRRILVLGKKKGGEIEVLEKVKTSFLPPPSQNQKRGTKNQSIHTSITYAKKRERERERKEIGNKTKQIK